MYNNPMYRFLLALALLLSACAPLPALPAGTPAATPTSATTFTVRVHPDGPIYSGDKVSFEVLAPDGYDLKDKSVRVDFNDETLGTQIFRPFGIGKRHQATLYWAWNTAGLETGSHTLTFTILPQGVSWAETISILPASDVPLPEPDARWESLTTDCCTIHYISATAAERDIETLADMADQEADRVETGFKAEFNEKIPLTFLPRTLGHGGFASDGIYVSYLDQNYAGNATAQVIRHEMVHWLDNEQGGDLRPTMLIEGLAVYLSDGHFKEEALLPRAAALLDLDWYIPLRTLSDSFYTSQHEIGYLQAGALIAYLVETYGWDEFNAFYRDIHPANSRSHADAIDSALQIHFGLSLDKVEQNFIEFLRKQTVSDDIRTDLHLSVAFYDTVRRYQQLLDPSAHFLSAWLPDIRSMREYEIVADLLRHPQAPINQQIEQLLVAADADLRAGHYAKAEARLRAINTLLDLRSKLE